MMQYGGGGQLCAYRDSIRRASVPGGQCRSALRFFPASSDHSSPSSSPALDASDTCSTVSLSFSSDSDLFFSGRLDGAEELRDIALQMVHDGYMKGLIRSFGAAGGSSSAHCGGLGPGPEELLLGTWFSELDVEWVLHTGEGDEVQPHLLEDGCASLLDLMESWIKGLKTMVQVLSFTQLGLLAKGPAVSGVGKAIRHFMLLATGKMAEREQEVAQFVRFAEASILRMLEFVDAVADAALNDGDDDQAAETLPGMLQVYTCVVDDSPTVLALFKEASGTTSMFDAMNKVFLRKRSKLSDAIWSMMEKVRASFLKDDCWRVSPADEAGGVHETTRLMMNYVTLLWRNEGALDFVLQDQQRRFKIFLSEPDDHCSSSAADLIKKMISCLEKQLEKASSFIPDPGSPGLRYIFLMNNCSFISEKVSSLLLLPLEDYKIEESRGSRDRERLSLEDCVNQPDRSIRATIERDSNLDGLIKIQNFMEAYLDVSWEPVMSCLYHDIPRGFLRCGGALDKFESEFQRTYAAHRMWKVPNPELRKRLRKAVSEKVISGYSQYMTERTARGKSNRPATRTPLDLEELLEELFEG
ncbi:hypothetical protein BAE44_0017893 [Dichanthelium oligosanthes]|uniref:Exocyst subunit Exo70 family protein n=1 Tax=Dichanthelium oligosanthes TaxID=888268 RepID=A0A1E5V7D7_9POAL|nr:hypothetical protein BAE44_0017893 [Dichanthelium oligosanthes]